MSAVGSARWRLTCLQGDIEDMISRKHMQTIAEVTPLSIGGKSPRKNPGLVVESALCRVLKGPIPLKRVGFTSTGLRPKAAGVQ